MKRMMTGVVLLAAVTFLTGCFSTTFSYSNRAPGRTEDVNRTFLIRGVVNSNDPLRAFEVCPEGVASVEVVHTFVDGLLGCVTLQIYTPNTVRVTCQGGVAHDFYLDENDEVIAQQSYDSGVSPIDHSIASDVL